MSLDQSLDNVLNSVLGHDATQLCLLYDGKTAQATITVDGTSYDLCRGEIVGKLMDYLKRKATPDEEGIPTYTLPYQEKQQVNPALSRKLVGYFRLVEENEGRLEVHINQEPLE